MVMIAALIIDAATVAAVGIAAGKCRNELQQEWPLAGHSDSATEPSSHPKQFGRLLFATEAKRAPSNASRANCG